jgi:hypothetical protein
VSGAAGSSAGRRSGHDAVLLLGRVLVARLGDEHVAREVDDVADVARAQRRQLAKHAVFLDRRALRARRTSLGRSAWTRSSFSRRAAFASATSPVTA